tara:strand:- start:164 stop:397 length:234 start_codon:yes stop_codon:yes gene_type:complete
MTEKTRLLDSIQTIKDSVKDVEEIKQQYETPILSDKVRPNNRDGVNGDRKIIKEGNNNFLYVKVEGRWMKTQLEEAR